MAPTPPPPSDLKVLCRKLVSTPQPQLPQAVPILTRHIIRCKDVLSSPQDPKSKESDVHKLFVTVTMLLNGRSREARFASIGLVKAIIDVGGWEMLRMSNSWVSGLLSVVQKGDPICSKELAILTLTRIYAAVQPFQTLAREIATSTLPTFITACLQLMKSQASSRAPTASTLIEAICDSFSKLTTLYPPTFRPNSPAIKSAVKAYLAPTFSDGLLVPRSLQRAARRLVITLPCVAAKSGGSEEWAKLVDNLLRELHATGDQVLRAVDESWQGTLGYSRGSVSSDGEPAGGSSSGEQLPSWEGLASGVDRFVGLFNYLADCLSCPTKNPVAIPAGALIDAVSRVCLIARQNPRSQTWEQALETNAAISREEKDELWSCMPDIHLSALALASRLVYRFGQGMIPLVPETLDHLVRVFKSGIANPVIRQAGYELLCGILSLVGPTMSKQTVVSIEPLIAACCRDLQEDAGFLKPAPKPSATSKTDCKKTSAKTLANADLFLQPQVTAAGSLVSLDGQHKAAANDLLTSLLTHLPQHHLKPTLRGLLDKTAILTRNCEAMTASVLNPYKDQRGHTYSNILPHLSQQYPRSQSLEILRSNLRVSTIPSCTDMLATVTEVDLDETDEEVDDEEMLQSQETNQEFNMKTIHEIVRLPSTQEAETLNRKAKSSERSNPFEVWEVSTVNVVEINGNTTEESPAKRKHENDDVAPSKRQEVAQPAVPILPEPVLDQGGDDGDDSDLSVHLNMELDDDDDDDEEEEERLT